MNVVSSLSDASKMQPGIEYYVIIHGKSTFVPGDQKSKDTGGAHGYGEHTDESLYMVTYPDKEAWERAIAEEIKSRFRSTEEWRAAILKFPKIETELLVKVQS